MRRWLWAGLALTSVNTAWVSTACDKTEAPSGPQDPAATATTTASASASASASATATAAVTTTPSAPKPAAPSASSSDPPRESAPLLYWMRDHAAKAMRDGDTVALSAAFEQIAAFSPKATPPAYANWTSIAKDGADAARAASLEGARGACRGCHTQYRAAYKAEMRSRPLD